MSRTPTSPLGDAEFTYDWYSHLLEWLTDQGYDSATFGDEVDDGDLLLRHDVDLSPRNALEMARLEEELGLQSTYFFLVTNPLYNVFDASCRTVIDEIDAMGHEVGVHFSTHQYWHERPPTDELVACVDAERSALAAVTETVCDPVSFHCPPDWVLDRRFDGVTSTYDPEYLSDATYVADSGQRWRRTPPFDEQPTGPVQVLTHPGVWGDSDLSYTERVTSGIAENVEYTERFLTGQLLEGEFKPPIGLSQNGAADR